MNTTPGRTRKILIRNQSGHIGKRANGLARYRLGVLGIGTALVGKFLYLDLGFHNWFGFLCWNIGISAFLFFGLVPQFSLSLAMNLVLLRTFYDWVFVCLSLLSCCFEIGGTSFLGWLCPNWVVIT